MNAILQSFGIDQNDSLGVIRIIDKIAKIGKESVISELRKMGIDNAEKIIATLTPEGTNKSTLEKSPNTTLPN